MAYFVAVLMSALGVLGDYYFKIAGDGQQYIEWKWFWLGMLVYALTGIGWFYVFKHMPLAMVGIVYTLSTITFLTLLAVLYFHERLTMVEIFALVAAVVIVLILARFA